MFKDIREEDERSDSGSDDYYYPAMSADENTKISSAKDQTALDDELTDQELKTMQSGILDAITQFKHRFRPAQQQVTEKEENVLPGRLRKKSYE